MSPSMRPMLVIGAIYLVVAITAGISEWRTAHAKEIIPWRPTLAAAQSEAGPAHRKVLAYFTATWCPPCKKMKTTTWADSTVAHAMEQYVPAKIDIDADKEAARRYHIEAVPTYIVLSDQGEVQKRISGLMSPEEMRTWLEQ